MIAFAFLSTISSVLIDMRDASIFSVGAPDPVKTSSTSIFGIFLIYAGCWVYLCLRDVALSGRLSLDPLCDPCLKDPRREDLADLRKFL